MKKIISAVLLATFLSVAAVFASASPVSANAVQDKKPMEKKAEARHHRRAKRRHHRRVVRRHRRNMHNTPATPKKP
jgi:hypothetical protein